MSFGQLNVESRWLTAAESAQLTNSRHGLLAHTDPQNPLVWFSQHTKAVGAGVAVQLCTTGANRFHQLQQQWQEVVRTATITDQVQVPGSGLIAFGTVAFAANSAAESLLIVPKTTVQEFRGRYFITTVHTAPPAPATVNTLPDALPLEVTAWQGAQLTAQPDAQTTSRYSAQTAAIAQAITAGSVQKVVLARQISAQIPASADLRVPLARLADTYAECAIFGIDGLLGASPETLARCIQGSVWARVLAGTAARNHSDTALDLQAGKSLLTSEQIENEHAYAAQSVIHALAPLVSELRTNTKPLIVPLPNVWHRATDITARSKPGHSVLDLVAAMHPTAAVAGTPTAAAMQLLTEVEEFDRGRYAGAVGWINADGDGEWALALRCAQVSAVTGSPQTPDRSSTHPPGTQQRTVVATAGGGLVAGSDTATELQETVIKFAPIVKAFAPES